MAALNRRLPAYILLESILAMVVVMVCFGVAVMIYNNVITGMRGRLQLQARLVLEQEALNARSANRLLDESRSTDVFTISKTVRPYVGTTSVYLLELTANDKEGRPLATHRELVRKP